MKRHLFPLLLCVLVAWNLSARAEPSTLRVAGITTSSKAYQAFASTHPDVEVQTTLNPFVRTNELLNALVSGSFAYDVFTVSSGSFDVGLLIDKGYCADLSACPEIQETVERMYPIFSELVCRDGKTYGVPYNCALSYLSYCPETWKALGWSAADAPDTFPEFLSTLEKWIAQAGDAPGIVAFNSFEETLYGPSSYTDLLTGLLIDSQILQCSYAGIPLRFDTPAFRACLERCMEIGRELYALEPVPNQGNALFVKSSGMESLSCLVSLRLTQEQSRLVPAHVSVAVVYAGALDPALSAEMALALLEANETRKAEAYLLQDAQPLEDPGYAESVAFWEEQVSSLSARLTQSDLSPTELEEGELELERYQAILSELHAGEGRYLISPSALETYRSCGDLLYAQPPHAFLSTNESDVNMRSLREQFANGLLPVDQFLQRMDQMAAMLELENQ